jgi:hypothetical protein
MARGGSVTARFDWLDIGTWEARVAKDSLELHDVAMAVRRARDELRRIGGEVRFHRFMRYPGKIIVRQIIPHAEDEGPVVTENAPGLAERA